MYLLMQAHISKLFQSWTQLTKVIAKWGKFKSKGMYLFLLEVFLYTGLIGFLIYILFISRIFVVSYKLYKQKSRILPTIIIPIALAFILILQGLNEKICWIIFAYIIGTYMYSFKKFKYLNEDFNSHWYFSKWWSSKT